MLAAVFAREGVLELEERPIPEIRNPDDVLLEVEGCGICGTDLHILEKPPTHPARAGVILGHEYIGRVVEVGSDVAYLRSGDRVAVAPNLSCGLCAVCRAGLLNHCRNFTTFGIFEDGGLSAYSRLPERACYRISNELPFEEAVWVEILSCVMNSVDKVDPRAGEEILVLGAGPAGALHCLLLLAAGVRVSVCDINPRRLSLLRDAGVHETINPKEELLQDVSDRRHGLGFDAVVDCVGDQLAASMELARVGGRISLFGMNTGALPVVPQNSITRKELTIYGSFIGVNTFARAIGVLENGVVRPSGLISKRVCLGQIHEAIEALRHGEEMKVVVCQMT